MSIVTGISHLLGESQDDNSVPPFTTPTYLDVRVTRAMLKSLNLPTELVLSILDLAEYWPAHRFEADKNVRILTASRGNLSSNAGLCLSASIFDNSTINAVPNGVEKPKIKAIEFDMKSEDQGWTSENTRGTYSTSSWLEVSILRNVAGDMSRCRLPDGQFQSPQAYQDTISDLGWSLVKRPESARQGPQDGEGDFAWYLQGNQVAVGPKNYRVVWGEDGVEGNEGAGQGQGFLQELKEGDIVLVWARAKWPGWQCIVESVDTTVVYRF